MVNVLVAMVQVIKSFHAENAMARVFSEVLADSVKEVVSILCLVNLVNLVKVPENTIQSLVTVVTGLVSIQNKCHVENVMVMVNFLSNVTNAMDVVTTKWIAENAVVQDGTSFKIN
jgi:hypothetical protein